jgi:hypothetical protein
MVRDVLD